MFETQGGPASPSRNGRHVLWYVPHSWIGPFLAIPRLCAGIPQTHCRHGPLPPWEDSVWPGAKTAAGAVVARANQSHALIPTVPFSPTHIPSTRWVYMGLSSRLASHYAYLFSCMREGHGSTHAHHHRLRGHDGLLNVLRYLVQFIQKIRVRQALLHTERDTKDTCEQ